MLFPLTFMIKRSIISWHFSKYYWAVMLNELGWCWGWCRIYTDEWLLRFVCGIVWFLCVCVGVYMCVLFVTDFVPLKISWWVGFTTRVITQLIGRGYEGAVRNLFSYYIGTWKLNLDLRSTGSDSHKRSHVNFSFLFLFAFVLWMWRLSLCFFPSPCLPSPGAPPPVSTVPA